MNKYRSKSGEYSSVGAGNDEQVQKQECRKSVGKSW